MKIQSLLICVRFDAKWTAISIKTHCKVYQNAGQFAPKRKAICTKTQGILHQNARYFAPKREVNCNELHEYNQQKGTICIFITIDIDREQRLLRCRSGEKRGYLGAKSRDFELLKMRGCIKLERQSGAKRMRWQPNQDKIEKGEAKNSGK